MTDRFWTVPNILSLSRLVVIPVWWWVMIAPEISDWWGAVIILYGIVSDVADGYLARRLNQVTQWGKLLDPIGDKVAALAVGVFCIVHRDMPIWAFGITVLRDVAILFGGWLLYRSRGNIPTSIDIGRYAALVWGVVLLLYAFDWQPWSHYILWPGLILYILAGLAYLRPALLKRAG